MDDKMIKELEAILLKEKAEAEVQLRKMKENGSKTSLLEWTGKLSSYDNHPADIGSESFEMEKMMTLNNNQQKLLDDINDAIEKIEKGTYGICETCSSEIDYERLKAIPYARECINCAKARLTNEDEYQRRRPIEEELLEPMIDNGLVQGDELDPALEVYRHLQVYGSADNMQDMGGPIKDYDDIHNIYDASIESIEEMDVLTNKDRKNSLY